MGPINRRHLRNQAGRFIKNFVNISPPREGTCLVAKMKPMGTVTKAKKFNRRSLDAPRIGKKTSVVWHFFKALPHENGISRAVCILCKVVFKNPGGSTTGMRGHLDRKHPGVVERVMETEKVETKHRPRLPVMKREIKRETRGSSPPPPHLSIENGAIGEVGEPDTFEDDSVIKVDQEGQQRILPGPPPEVYSVTDTDEVTKSIVMLLATSIQPLRMVEDGHFKKTINNLNSTYMMEAGNVGGDSVFNAVVNAMDDLYKEAKEEIQRKLQGKQYSIHLELWVKTNSDIYLGVTAHSVNRDWQLETCFLGLRPLPDICLISPLDTVTEKVSQLVNNLLEEYDLKSDKIVHVLFNSSPLSLNSNILSVNTWPCLNDIIRRNYDLLNEFLVSLTNCDLLHNTLKIAKQVLPNYKDVKCHPGKLMEAMKGFLSNHATDSLPVKVEDLEECIKLQEPLNTIVDILLEQPVLTSSSILPLIFFVRSAYESQINEGSSNWSKEQRQEMVNAIINQIESCYKLDLNSTELGDPMLALCSFFDPRYKKLTFLTVEQRDYVYDAVTELLHDLEKERASNSDTGSIISVRSENPAYNNMNGTAVNSTTDPLNPSTPSSSGQTSGLPSKLAATLTGIMRRRLVKVPSSESVEELTHYWDEPVSALTMDPYEWWSYNHERFPKLSELAKRYFSIRGTSSFAKMVFTGAGKQFHNQLANIETEFVDKLQVLRRSATPYSFAEAGRDTMDVEIKTEIVESVVLMEEEI